MSTFTIEIDATQTSFSQFFIPDAFDATRVQSLKLEPGSFGFQVEAGVPPAFQFHISSSGIIDQLTPDSTTAFVDGLDTPKLTVRGLEVTLDAKCLSTGILVANTDGNFHAFQIFRLLPGRYGIQDLSGGQTKIPFDVDAEGRATLINAADTGFVVLRGTSTIKYFGFPVLIDARNVDEVGGKQVNGVGISSNTELIFFDNNKVLFVTLLPGDFELQLTSGVGHSGVTFHIDQIGNISFDPNSGNNSSLRFERITIPVLQIVGSAEPCPLQLSR